jgi:hypothetical protein
MQYFKVTNTAIIPCHIGWNQALLDDEELEKYEEFKKTSDYVGYDEEDAALKKKLAEAVKVRPFYETLGRDVRIKVFDATRDGKSARYEWQFCIGPDITKLKKKDDLSETRRICEEFGIPVGMDETVAVLANKLGEEFGPNERILTETQWMESGLKAREYKEIKLKLKPGESTQRIETEGYLKAVPMADVEAEAYQKKMDAKASKK